MICSLEKETLLDPRTAIVLLVMSNVIAFLHHSLYIEIALIGSIAILMICCECKISALKWVATFAFLLIIQYWVLPIMPKAIEDALIFLPMYFRKFFPCLMIATIIIKRISAKHVTTALQKWKFPWQIIVPLAIAMRYFPTIKEEIRYIRDAMKLRNIRGLVKFECLMVSIIVSATNAAEELSAAAVTRGIENPCAKTSIVILRFKALDYISLVVGVVLLASTFMV